MPRDKISKEHVERLRAQVNAMKEQLKTAEHQFNEDKCREVVDTLFVQLRQGSVTVYEFIKRIREMKYV